MEHAEVRLLVMVGEEQHLSLKRTWVDKVRTQMRSLKKEVVVEACQIGDGARMESTGVSLVAKEQKWAIVEGNGVRTKNSCRDLMISSRTISSRGASVNMESV